MENLTEKQFKRFWERVNKNGENDCWEWIGARFLEGYGKVDTRLGGGGYCHRISWILKNGKIPEGMCICHTCDNPPCVNPSHLFISTHHENMLDRARKGRSGGEKRRKLSEDKRKEIRARYVFKGADNTRSLAREFGVNRDTVRAILKEVSE